MNAPMTMSPTTPSETQLADTFFERMAEIDALVAFARGDVPELVELPSFDRALLTRMRRSAAERAQVARWARAFTRSIELLDAFRDAEISSPRKATEDQLQDVIDGAEELLAALRERFQESD